jgi:putative transferase (TIGR04331 family)
VKKNNYLFSGADVDSSLSFEDYIFLGYAAEPKCYSSKLNFNRSVTLYLNQNRYKENLELAKNFEDAISSKLYEALNQIHDISFDQIQWDILLRNWLRRIVSVLVFRESLLRLSQEISSNVIYITKDRHDCNLSRETSLGAIHSYNEQSWINLLDISLIKLLCLNIALEKINSEGVTESVKDMVVQKNSLRTVLNLFKDCYQKIAFRLQPNKKVFICNTYLSTLQNFLLQIRFRQLPLVYKAQRYNSNRTFNSETRELLANLTINKLKNSNIFSPSTSAFTKIISDSIPICYLEGFNDLYRQAISTKWSNKPEIIFTSNNFDFDDVFKMWVAIQKNRGVQYVIGQHGGNYGTSSLFDNPSPEEKYADKFLTWGWSIDPSKHFPLFCFLQKKHNKRIANTHSLYIMLGALGNIDKLHDSWVYFDNSIRNAIDIYKRVKNTSRFRVIIRMHPSTAGYKYNVKERIIRDCPGVNIDSGENKISNVYKNARLVVHLFNSTGFLECIYKNIPTLLYLHKGYDEIRFEALDDYRNLEAHGVFFTDLNKMLAHINTEWNSIDDWWGSKAVQSALGSFRNKYTREEKNKIEILYQNLCN